MVTDLSKIAQGKFSDETTVQENKLKTLGLECSVTIMKSLVDWSKDLRVEQNVEETGFYLTLFFLLLLTLHLANEKQTNSNPEKQEENVTHNHKKGNTPNFHEVKQYKFLLQQGIAKFNLSPKKVNKTMF